MLGAQCPAPVQALHIKLGHGSKILPTATPSRQQGSFSWRGSPNSSLAVQLCVYVCTPLLGMPDSKLSVYPVASPVKRVYIVYIVL